MEKTFNKDDCVISKHRHEFTCPDNLLDDFMSSNVVLFAGAGISTESRNVLYYTFHDTIKNELGYEDDNISFPELMEEYCNQSNGRIKLISKIKQRLKYIESFPELYGNATKFHTSLATLSPLNTIVTTNWDTYFEDVCNATPFVSDQDLAFWEIDERRVLKIHGSINNYGSIVATSSDYEACKKRLHKGLIGSVLKTLLATKTVAFIGYSLTDHDFLSIFDFVSEQMKGFQRQAFIVTPSKDECKNFEQIGLIPIITDGEYFISQIKQYLVAKKVMLPDSIYSDANHLNLLVDLEHKRLHKKYSCFDHPQIIYAASYQDGMKHALDRICTFKRCGDYSDPVKFNGIFKPYIEWQKEKLKSKIYESVAYIAGYLNGLAFVLMNDEEKKQQYGLPPLYYAFGVKDKIKTLTDFEKVLEDLPKLHKTSYKRAKRAVDKLTNKSINI